MLRNVANLLLLLGYCLEFRREVIETYSEGVMIRTPGKINRHIRRVRSNEASLRALSLIGRIKGRAAVSNG